MAKIYVPDDRKLIVGKVGLYAPAQTNRSIWTGRSQTVGLPGAEIWSFNATIETLTTEAEERPWRGFLFRLGGGKNSFDLRLCKQCHIGPKPVIGAAATAGYEVPLTGMTPNLSILEAGQYITVPLPSGHHRLAMLTDALRSDASGNALAKINVGLGEIPFLGAAVETSEPYCPVKAFDPNPELTYEGSTSTASLELMEAL